MALSDGRANREHDKFVQDSDGNTAVRVVPTGVPTLITSAGAYGAKTVSTSAVLMNVSGTNFTGRQTLTIQPDDGEVYWGFDSSVTTSNGTKIARGTLAVFSIQDDVDIYCISSTTVDTRVTEN